MIGRWLWYGVVGASAVLGFGYALRDRVQSVVPDKSIDLVARGREVYISEGCIHCHSQYIRPVGMDTELWGPPTSPDKALAQSPVLIGNRRQGPDLSTVGSRLSPDWNRRHLIDPPGIVKGSRMPSFAHLFDGEESSRGEALLAYLDSLRAEKRIQ
ncbi:cbb3-type cytochrome c oxidase subunit II [Puniceicoccus vermicola]|uniref:Cbb3-type cytochrome c oxidase subunit II n=1 Tax=Puniceicoccus vermicola TaxID=388746 RepID=A0A7X1B1T1_9BACT|nr:cbb3-type cytochrome c oxidase subunit II [Puniceicoccus vermicola]MBC2603962.1 cbb3-type cytochrome c oxidase subunit II [Puniceicoccus vermicola]